MNEEYQGYTHSSPTVREYYATKRIRQLERDRRRTGITAYLLGVISAIAAEIIIELLTQ